MKSLIVCPSQAVSQPATPFSVEQQQGDNSSMGVGHLPAGQSVNPMPIPSRPFDERAPESNLSMSVSPRGYPPKKVVKRSRSISTPPAGIYYFTPPIQQLRDQLIGDQLEQ